jgi:hypothetical protein
MVWTIRLRGGRLLEKQQGKHMIRERGIPCSITDEEDI